MNSLPEQHIDTLPKDAREDAYRQVGMVCAFRSQGLAEDEVADKAKFDSVGDMYFRLKRWGLSGLVPLEEESEETSETARERKARQVEGESEELPPPTNATTDFETAVSSLGMRITYIASLKETLQGKRFMSEAAGGATEGVAGRGAMGGRWFPHPDLTILIAACVLESVGHAPVLERLLGELHPEPLEANRKQLLRFVHGIDLDAKGGPKDRGDGFVQRALQVAALIRGMREIPPGVKPPRLDATEQLIAWSIRARIEGGLSEEEAAREVQREHSLDREEYSRLRNLARNLK